MPQISTVKYSDIENESKNHRFDAEFFRKDYLDMQKLLRNRSDKTLGDFGVKVYHPKEIKRVFADDGVLFLRAQNVRPLKVDLTNKVYISKKDAEKLKSNLIKTEDILITRTGANFGQCALFNEDIKAIASSHTFIVRSESINPYLLSVFLNTKYGRKMIDKGMYGGLQPEVAPFYLLNIPFPNFSKKTSNEVEKNFKLSLEKQNQSKELYKEAEELLLKELDLLDYKPIHILTFETTASEIENAKRFDGEYFQPEYLEVIKRIENSKRGFDIVKNIVKLKKGIEVGTDAYTETGKDFIRVSDFSTFGTAESSKKISDELFEEIKENFQPKKGDILFTKDGTIGITYVLKEDVNGVLSSAFLRLSLRKDYKELSKEYLCLVFSSILSKLQIEQLSGGAIIAHLKPSDFEKIKIPLVKQKIQEKISEKVKESYELRKEGKELLEKAKKMVEDEIEK